MKRFLAIFGKRRLDRELDDELRFHLDALIEHNLRRGMTQDQARHEAQRRIRKMNLAMRTSGDPLALANAVRREVARLDPELPVTKLRTIQQILDSSLAPRRLSMWLLTVFALAALLLAALGIYGVMAYAVARRTREIGIRMALGAQWVNVLGMIMGQGMKLVAAGLALGLAASLALTRLMTSLLYDVKPTDPLTYAAVALLLILIALAANFAPARRAVSVDPTVALRHE
jgi:putative ABC transport system permease protein